MSITWGDIASRSGSGNGGSKSKMRSYKRGGKVKKSGRALLHRGEMIKRGKGKRSRRRAARS